MVYSSPKFLFRGLRIHLPSPPPPDLCSAVYVLFYWKFALRTWLQKQLGFSHWLRTRARMQAGKGKVWTGGKNGEWVWWEWVSHSWRSTWCTSFLPLVLPWILFMVWLFFSLFISLAKVLNLHCYFPSIAGSLSSFFIIFFPDFFVFVPAHWQLVFLDRRWSLAIFKWSSLLSFLAGTPNLGGKRIKDWSPWLLWQSFGERTKLHWTKKAI